MEHKMGSSSESVPLQSKTTASTRSRESARADPRGAKNFLPAAWDSLNRESQARQPLKPAAFAAGPHRRQTDRAWIRGARRVSCPQLGIRSTANPKRDNP